MSRLQESSGTIGARRLGQWQRNVYEQYLFNVDTYILCSLIFLFRVTEQQGVLLCSLF